ncbi:MAG TPA: endonuclease III [Clostridia bacterium]|nr:endonuclease III [Clostridia bacterium]
MNIIEDSLVDVVYNKLDLMYPEAFCGLIHRDPFELLIATILSAQCTDVRVNIITADLFEQYNTPEKIYALGQKELKKIIRSCGLSKSKSKNIIKTCELLIEEFDSKVPKEKKKLLKLPGVGVKTANVVQAVAFGIPQIAVDTHVFRVSNRIGLVDGDTVGKTEKMLRERFDKSKWIRLHHLLIFHGRDLCKARSPQCVACDLNEICLFYKEGESDE